MLNLLPITMSTFETPRKPGNTVWRDQRQAREPNGIQDPELSPRPSPQSPPGVSEQRNWVTVPPAHPDAGFPFSGPTRPSGELSPPLLVRPTETSAQPQAPHPEQLSLLAKE